MTRRETMKILVFIFLWSDKLLLSVVSYVPGPALPPSF